MARYDAYEEIPVTASAARGWMITALTGSLVVHLGLFVYFYTKRIENFDPPPEDAVVVKYELMNVKQVKIDPLTLEPENKAVLTETKKPTARPEINIPTEKPKLEELHFAPAHKPIDSNLIPDEKPAMEVASIDQSKVKSSQADDLLPKLDESYFTPNRTGPTVKALDSTNPAGGDGSSTAISVGNQSVGQILDKLGSGGGNPVLSLPGNTTFDYNSALLGTDGRDAMATITEVFRKFLGDSLPDATFVISGHTDSFGTPQYNLQLSEQRAETVKAWLVANLNIAPEKIQTVGMGSTRPVVPVTGTIDEQTQNRRVEIVIKRPKK